jgi:signal transduction histidine kinase
MITLAACHHHARMRALERLRAALREKDAANVELQRATQAKSQFLANMSHGTTERVSRRGRCGRSYNTSMAELRTPMHGIIAMSRELQDTITPSSDAGRAVTIISGSVTYPRPCIQLCRTFPHLTSPVHRLRGALAVAGERHPRL